jgi:hypothetical protein
MTSCSRIVAFTATALLVPAGTAAAEGGFIEAVVGVAVPVAGDENYEELEEELKLGARAGSGGGPTAIELGLDYTPFGREDASGPLGEIDVGADRFRVLAGVRHRVPMGTTKGSLFLRGGVGVDIVRLSVSGTILGQPFEESETDLGIAAEVGGGFTFPLGTKAYVGAHLAVPIAFHFDDDDPDDDADADLEYTGFDLDVLFTVGTTM